MNQIFKTKSLEHVLAETESGDGERLKRVLGPWSLTALGIGAIIGTGIFVLVGQAARDLTGPSLMVSFIVAGLACIFAALCYAEFASMAPVAGSAYTYAYLTLGELMAWIIGWDLILEYAVASCTVAHGWSKYLGKLLAMMGMAVPGVVHEAPFSLHPNTGEVVVGHVEKLKDDQGNDLKKKITEANGKEREVFVLKTDAAGKEVVTHTWLDLPAALVALAITAILVKGIKESAGFNALMVAIKVSVVLLVIGVGAFYVNPKNWENFAPYGYGGLSFFGHVVWGELRPNGLPRGMLAGAAMIFFAYLGFDAVSTNAEEAKNPKRDLPIGIIGSLVICTILYIAVAGVLTGMVPYTQIDKDAPVADAFARQGLTWFTVLIIIGAVTGITSVLLVMMLGQARIFLAMARDGLLPKALTRVHPTFKTPWWATILTGLLVALGGSLLPLDILADLTSIGTLFAFVVVCAAVLVLRVTQPNLERPFKAPLGILTPIIGIALCLLLMFSLSWENWARLVIWLMVGLAIYFTFGVKHSKLRDLQAK